MTFTCPTCDRTIYNRRRVTCEFCGETIPSELLFNPAQIAAIERLKAVEKRDHRNSTRRGMPLRAQREQGFSAVCDERS